MVIWVAWLFCLTATVAMAQTPPIVKVIQPVGPLYPRLATQARILGYVLIDVDIEKSGKVKEAHVVRGIPLLDAVSAKAAAKWQFGESNEKGLRTVRLLFAFDLICDPKPGDEVKTTYAPPFRIDVRAEVHGGCDSIAAARERAFEGVGHSQ